MPALEAVLQDVLLLSPSDRALLLERISLK